ncbi:MAG TPA: hypothetical protein PKY47_07785 [Acetomicrobium sp.]|uniref:hypothetical protein n=1 Tax=Acetomicrobium mobile TaxID=97477 RepID=UPI0026F2F4D7|nr:hypothetical protein [Acetomicrobium mobile]HQA37249.1 hypothetical protein [Acetomicrobium sp.]
MSALNSPIDLKNISPMVKEVTKEWMREILASDESEDRYDSIRNLYKKFNEALMKEYGDKGSECVNQKFGELKPQVDFLASLFYCINDDLRNRQREMKFDSPKEEDDFLHGRDFNRGLLDVRDEEFDAVLESLLSKVRSLVKNDALEAGWALNPKDPPNLFMSSIPLIEGNWIDKVALEVLEWHQALLKEGYETHRPEKENLIAWPIVLEEGQDEEALKGVIVKVGDFGILDKNRQYAIFVEAEERINLLRLKERIVDGRAYVSLAEYFDSTEHLLTQEDFCVIGPV